MTTHSSPALFVLALLGASGCSDPAEPISLQRIEAEEFQTLARRPGDVGSFVDVTAEWGIMADPEAWPAGTYATHELTGGGVAVLDYDADGDLDLLQARFPPPGRPDTPAPNRLYQQQADGSFVDVSETSGLADPGYGQGVAVGDADNDGDLDVYFTNFGPDKFYRNNGDGTFVDATAESGMNDTSWSTSAAFADFDLDGDLDLYVVHYVKFNSAVDCQWKNSLPDFCGPNNFQAAIDTLYCNLGDGKFVDVTAGVGIAEPGKGLGVVCSDFTGDGAVDFYVANDGEANQLWVNDGAGNFTDQAVIRGAAFNGYGKPEGSMGVAVGDANGDGRLDLFMTHIAEETNTLYLANDAAMFADRSDAAGLGRIDLPYTGFGCGFFDFDNDGDLDLAIANGRVKRGSELRGSAGHGFWGPYVEQNLLLQNTGSGTFTRAAENAGEFGDRLEISRGLAFGDLDRDGDLDLVVGNIGGPPRIYRNDVAFPSSGAHWLAVRALVARRDAIGAQVTLLAGDQRFVRLVLPGYSYASSSDPRCHFGLGTVERIEAIDVAWPDGSVERFQVEGVDQQVTLVQGEGNQR